MSAEHIEQKSRIRLALLSIVAGAVLLGLKYLAYVLSGSVALKSDAIESIVNVVAAVFALGAVVFAASPPTGNIPTVTARSSTSAPPSRAGSSPWPRCSSSTRPPRASSTESSTRTSAWAWP